MVGVLQRGGDSRFVELALPLLTDEVPGRRQMAAWFVVARPVRLPGGRPFGDPVEPALVAAAGKETDNKTREDLVTALGFAEDPAWAAGLAQFASDPYPLVRLAVARSSYGTGSRSGGWAAVLLLD